MSKTLQGKEGFNHAFITEENAEGRGKNCALFPTFCVFSVFRALVGMIYTNLFLILLKNLFLIYFRINVLDLP
jgi:hypothetical protein